MVKESDNYKRTEIYDQLSLVTELESLPKGNITYKVIRGRKRMYLQWTEAGKRRSRYVRAEDEVFVLAQIERRHYLEEQLRRRTYSEQYSISRDHSYQPSIAADDADADTAYHAFSLYPWAVSVTTGEQLSALVAGSASYEKRDCYAFLQKYLDSDQTGRVCILYGLRRTGKTTMLFQAISDLPHDKTAYIKIGPRDTMDDLNQDLRLLSARGISYVFIDEVTLLSDFIDTASLLSDIYAQMGMKIILSGTDSLGFALSEADELYDRTAMIHTTFIPFREYSRLLGSDDIDEYIRYGGTLCAADAESPNNVNIKGAGPAHSRAFGSEEAVKKYIDTSIAHNIQHSLINYDRGGHFRHLLELYEADELTSAVNRIVEDMNHRFVLSVLMRDWESHDLGSARQLLRKEYAGRGEVSPLALIDTAAVTDRVKTRLEILNSYESEVKLTEAHVLEIRQYLKMLDLIIDCPSENADSWTSTPNILFTQPGMRYCQAKTLVRSLMDDEYFSMLMPEDRKHVVDTILSDVRGRMLEDIVLLETVKSLPDGMRAFKLQFAAGEIDMVIYDTDELTCRLYEVKHSDQTDPIQYRHIIDEEKLSAIERRFGRVISKTVLYRGEANTIELDNHRINYVNIGDYLRSLRIIQQEK